jgi:protoporphyrin/coproporphyrin ferrochelatase
VTGEPRPDPVGVLVMAHGTPSSREEIPAFYTAIRRGRPPTPEQLDELIGRYEAIGGTSPLTERTRAQVEGLSSALSSIEPGRYRVAYGSKFTTPTIEDGITDLAGGGAQRVVGIVLTPHLSSRGSGEYLRRAADAVTTSEQPRAEFRAVESWHRAPGLAELLAERTESAIASLDAGRRRRVAVFFTAHSVPERAVAGNDPYRRQVTESAADIASLLDLDTVEGVTWDVAWQSAGRTPEPWIGPGLLDSLRETAAAGTTAVVVCPVGFVSDHLEILYDLDVEAARQAATLGLAFTRTRSLNDDPRFLAVLADVVRKADRAGGSGSPLDGAGRSGTS